MMKNMYLLIDRELFDKVFLLPLSGLDKSINFFNDYYGSRKVEKRIDGGSDCNR